MTGIESIEAKEAGRLFTELEGIDLDPAAEVCVASLIEAAESGIVGKEETILLNITGGGYRRAAEDLEMIPVRPSAALTGPGDIEMLKEQIMKWMEKYA